MNIIHFENKKLNILAALVLPIYVMGVLYFTMLWHSHGFLGYYKLHVNLIPLFWLWEPIFTGKNFYLDQVALNLIMFAPIGILIPMLLRSCKLKTIFIIAIISSLTIEFIQPFFGRCTDIDDLILNTLGAVIGFIMLKLFTVISSDKRHDVQHIAFPVLKQRQKVRTSAAGGKYTV